MPPDPVVPDVETLRVAWAGSRLGDLATFEKSYRIGHFLAFASEHPRLRNDFVLKGGTRLNFGLDPMPRLSVDLDYVFVGAIDRAGTDAARPRIHADLQRLSSFLGYALRREPISYNVWTYRLSYKNVEGADASFKLDIQWLERIPLYPPVQAPIPTALGIEEGSLTFPALDLDEAYAGKMRALATRGEAKDVFDVAEASRRGVRLDPPRLRAATLFYLHMVDARLPADLAAAARRLNPGSYQGGLAPYVAGINLRERFPEDLKLACSTLHGATSERNVPERAFETRLLEGTFEPRLLFGGIEVQAGIENHPGGRWRALHPRPARAEVPEG